MRFNFYTVLIFLTLACNSFFVVANDADDFLAALKNHYHSTTSMEAFSLTHSYMGRIDPYQSWDFAAPGRYQAFKITEIDFKNQHYYQNVVHHNTGGLYFDEVHFQNDSESLRYERNGIPLGKRAVEQSMDSFARYKNLTLMNLDFFAVRPLLALSNADHIEYQSDEISGHTTVVQRNSNNVVMEYVFNSNPLRLLSVTNKTRNRVYLYDDYRTNQGHYFAHSVVKHYNGDQAPSFISRIESFQVMKKIDAEKLRLPAGYTRFLKEPDRALHLTQLAQDLYLIADGTARENTLVNVTGDSIMAFGVPMRGEQARQTIALIKEHFPHHDIAGVYVTHPYNEHISGLLPYAEMGIKIFADNYTIAAIKAYPCFAREIDTFKFESVIHGQVMDNVRFYVLENARSRRQGFAYFEQSGIIFQSDFLEIANDNTIPDILPGYSKQFIEFVRSEGLNVTRLVNNHRNNDISVETMNRAYLANSM